MFKLYHDVSVRCIVAKDTILCRLYTSHTKNLFALSLDAMLSMIQKTIKQQYENHMKGLVPTTLDDQEKEDQKNHVYTLEIYQYRDDVSREFVARAPNLIDDVPLEYLKRLGSVKLDTHLFHIFNIINHHFFNLHEVSQTEETETHYWKWTIEKQIHTILHVFSTSPWASSALLFSMIGKTNIGLVSDIITGVNKQIVVKGNEKRFVRSENHAAYTLYKIQGPVLVYFGMSGSDDYVKKELFRMFDTIDEYNIQFILLPDEAGIPMLEEFYDKWNLFKSFAVPSDNKTTSSSPLFDTQWKMYTRLQQKKSVHVGNGMVIELDK